MRDIFRILNTIVSSQKCFHNTNIILNIHFTELLYTNVFLGLKLLHLIHTLCLNHFRQTTKLK